MSKYFYAKLLLVEPGNKNIENRIAVCYEKLISNR